MKILVVFVDMIRPNRLSIINKRISPNTPLDEFLKKLGGTFYKNCFSQGPDTPRGLATFATGKIPNKNGCNTRTKWPRDFLNKDLKTVYDLFVEKNYKMTFFSNPNERECGMFPEHITNMDIHNNNYDLDKYLKAVELKKNHFMFISLPDFHWSFDDNGYTVYGEKKANKDVVNSLEVIFNNFSKDDFDHIFMFSDHGFKFIHELKIQPKYMILNEDRTNILMLHRKKGDPINIKINEKLCAITDIFYTLDEIINKKKSDESLFSEKEKTHIIIEDHLTFETSVNQSIEIWAIAMAENIYVRVMETGYLIDRNNNIKFGVIDEFDNILKKESSFKKFDYEFKKVFKYNELILKQTKFMYGGQRKKISKILNMYNIIRDIIKEKKSDKDIH
tara:strand:- start:11570 stop:12739 length:1170 start_codon:yes stop_codon:yes gene_type:complete